MAFSVVSSFIFFLLVETQYVYSSEKDIVVMLQANVLQKSIELTCYVSKLHHEVEFIDPSGNIRADCAAPIPSAPPICRPDNITTQDLDEKLTKLIISPVTELDIGKWGCKHGTNRGSNFVTVSVLIVSSEHQDQFGMNSTDYKDDTTEAVTNLTDTSEDSNSQDSTIVIVVSVLIVPILCLILLWHFKKGPWSSERREPESIALLGRNATENKHEREDKTIRNCSNCKKPTRFCYCYECSKSFCEICSEEHANDPKHRGHHIIQMHHSHENYKNVKLKCKNCNVGDVSVVCFKCTENHAKCLECACEHQTNSSDVVLPVIKEPIGVISNQKGTGGQEPKIPVALRIDLTKKKPRVRGLGLLNTDTVLVTDFWEQKLLYSNGKESCLESRLSSEPRGLVRLDKPNTYALTFGYEHKIKLYEINDNRFSMNPFKKFDHLDVDGHPFQIAYHKGLFAVEMNEGSDGKIVIMAANDNDYMIGYFTGNSLRLALNRDKEDVYVSAIGKQTLFCLNFEGYIKWQIQIPSPRSVVEIPGNEFHETRILLASRRSNKIFDIRCKKSTSSDDYQLSTPRALPLDDLKTPDFIEYRKLKGLDGEERGYITVEVEKFKVHVYELSNL